VSTQPSTESRAGSRNLLPLDRSALTVVAAPDKFRGTATARQVASSMSAAVAAAGGRCVEVPLADGGEGTLDALGGPNRQTLVDGPLGAPVMAGWRLVDRTAVVEMSLASGLVVAGGATGNDPVAASSRGTGQLIAAAIDAGAREVLVGVGGSATTDGGRGALEVLRRIAPFGAAGRPRVVVAADVTTLFTEAGRTFGPQKGASPGYVQLLTRRLQTLRRAYLDEFGVDVESVAGSGAAGGLAGGLAALGAEVVPGFQVVASQVGLAAAIAESDLVITGEGRLDAQSFEGKVVGGVTTLAAAAGVPVLAVVGSVAPATPDRGAEVICLEAEYGDRSWTDTAAVVESAVGCFLRDRISS
jgi:glycerate kinase